MDLLGTRIVQHLRFGGCQLQAALCELRLAFPPLLAKTLGEHQVRPHILAGTLSIPHQFATRLQHTKPVFAPRYQLPPPNASHATRAIHHLRGVSRNPHAVERKRTRIRQSIYLSRPMHMDSHRNANACSRHQKSSARQPAM